MSNNIQPRDNKPPESSVSDSLSLAHFCSGLISRKFNLSRFPTSQTLRCAFCTPNFRGELRILRITRLKIYNPRCFVCFFFIFFFLLYLHNDKKTYQFIHWNVT